MLASPTTTKPLKIALKNAVLILGVLYLLYNTFERVNHLRKHVSVKNFFFFDVADRAVDDFSLIHEAHFAEDVFTGLNYHHIDRDTIAKPAVEVLSDHSFDLAHFRYEILTPRLEARQQIVAPIDRVEVVCTVQASDFLLWSVAFVDQTVYLIKFSVVFKFNEIESFLYSFDAYIYSG